jgi:hypothetical protein
MDYWTKLTENASRLAAYIRPTWANGFIYDIYRPTVDGEKMTWAASGKAVTFTRDAITNGRTLADMLFAVGTDGEEYCIWLSVYN